MHENPTQGPAEKLNNAERDVLYLLTEPDGGQPLWSITDIGREIESVGDADIAVNGLLRAGLIYRTCDGFMFASRAGVRVVQMIGHVV
jgi:hypothetical protein